MKMLALLEKSRRFWFLLVVSVLFFLLRLPSLFEPYWYGDEGIYQVVGMAMRNGSLLYRDIWDNKPPLLYIIYEIFSSDQFTIRFVSLIFGLLSIFAFFFLSKKLFLTKNSDIKIVYFISSLYAVLLGLPLLEGNIANAENFMLLPIILSGFLIVKVLTKQKNNSQLFIPGVLLSFAFLFKIVAVFDFAAFFLFIVFIKFKGIKDLKNLVFELLPFVAGFFIPIFLTFLFFFINSALLDFIKAAFMQNVGYVGYGNKFLIPQGLLLTKLFILSLFTIFLFVKRKSIHKTTLFVMLWLSFSIFNALFSQRPYTHYLLVLLPGFSLFLGLLLWDKKIKKAGFIISILLFFVVTSFSFYKKTLNYYQNFILFINGSKSVSQYRAFFDRNTPNDYELAQFIKSHANESDNIFIWGNNAQVYKLVNKLPPGRFTVIYHITASPVYINETLKDLRKARPKYIIITSLQNQIPYNLSGYQPRIKINNSVIYEYTL